MEEDFINICTVDFFYEQSTIATSDAIPYTNKLYENHLLPSIEKLIQKYRQYHLNIPKIEIDLGDVSPNDLGEAVYKALEDYLLEHIQLKKAKEERQHANTRSIDKTAEPLDIFFNYIVFPQTPWQNANQPDAFDIKTVSASAFDLCLQHPKVFDRWLYIVQTNTYALERSITLMSPSVISAFIDRVVQIYQDKQSIGVINELVNLSDDISSHQAAFLSALLSYLVDSLDNTYEPNTILTYFKQSTFLQIIDNNTWQHMEQHIKNALFVEKTKNVVDKHTKKGQVGTISQNQDLSYQQQNDISELSNTIDDRNIEHSSATKNTLQYDSTQKNKVIPCHKKDELPEQRIPIYNAGIVLLHPMISTFFKNVHLVDKQLAFISSQAQMRAVFLLQYLTGATKQNYAEHFLHLNKLLCHLPINYPLVHDFEITPAEKEEADILLKTFVKYWTSVKSSSVKSIQEAFIRRKGLLEKSGQDWIIRVETKGIDILLEGLPWQIEHISLPWCEQLFYIDWKLPK